MDLARSASGLLSKDTIRHAFFAITMESMAHLCKIYLSKMVIFHNDVEKTRGYIHLNVVPGAQPLLEKKSEKIEADFPITGTSHKKWRYMPVSRNGETTGKNRWLVP